MSIDVLFDAMYTRIPIAGCWLWEGAVNNQGYGVLRRQGKNHLAHRYSFVLHGGVLVANALHRCDTPLCVNPYHLFDGTQERNMRDCAAKGRVNVKLTAECVRAIREDARSLKVIAKELGVSRSSVWRVKHHATWFHI